MRTKPWRALVLTVLVGGLLALPLTASADDEKRVVAGAELHLTGPNSASGTFSAALAVSDSGTTGATFTVTPSKDDEGVLDGNEVFNGTLGSFTIHFHGTAFPLSSPRQVGEGMWRVMSGTGVYADLRGRGSFLVVADAVTQTVKGSLDGKVRHGEDD
jgi:hypothetical protein